MITLSCSFFFCILTPVHLEQKCSHLGVGGWEVSSTSPTAGRSMNRQQAACNVLQSVLQLLT